MRHPSQALFRDLVEFAPDALVVIDSSGTVVYANVHAHTLFGYDPGELTGVLV